MSCNNACSSDCRVRVVHQRPQLRVDRAGRVGVVAQVVGQRLEQPVDPASQRMVRIRLHLSQFGDHHIQQTGGALVGRRQPADDALILDELLELRVQGVAVLPDVRVEPRHADVDQRSLPLPLDGTRQKLTEHGRVGAAVEVTPHQGEDGVGEDPLVERVQQRGDARRELASDHRRHVRLGEALGEAAYQPCFDDLRGHGVGGEEVAGDEFTQLGSELVLLARDQRGMRDAQAERVAKQRRDSKPVGDAADHGGLRGSAQEARRGVVRQGERREEDQRGQHQQAGGGALHAAQRGRVALEQSGHLSQRCGHAQRRRGRRAVPNSSPMPIDVSSSAPSSSAGPAIAYASASSTAVCAIGAPPGRLCGGP